MRLFAAIKPPFHITKQLMRLQKGVSGARWIEPDKLHLTLGFFGDVSDDYTEMLDHELATHGQTGFEVRLKGVGHFGTKEPRSLWAGADMSDELKALYKHCRRSARACKINMDSRDFRPHVTLAYIRGEPRLDRIIAFEKRNLDFKLKPFLVDEFFLISSQSRPGNSNLYRVEASYPLTG